MCGITGFIDGRGAQPRERLLRRVEAMTQTLRHRGPDAEGVWCEPAAGVALGFRRLAILDLAPTGNQPMTSANGRYTVVFNGEIYNHRELRQELEARHEFRGRSDTEVLLAAYSEWGIDAALKRLHGMFAIACWDALGRELLLARDRIGIKPLYYGRSGGAFLFGSELQACRQFPGFRETVSPQALAQYFQFGYVSAPYSIYSDMWKLPPGHLLRVDRTGEYGTPEPFWSLEAAMADRPAAGTPAGELSQELERRLRHAVRQHLVADVPVGAFLSGGIDSSSVVALMQAESIRPVRTFTIGFKERAFDEAPFARAVAQRLGTEHTEVTLGHDEALAAIPTIAGIYDEPFADSSQIPTYLVSRVARASVTVALSGDGGDELFGGYNRYINGPRLWRRLRQVPYPVRRLVQRALLATPLPARRAISTLLAPGFRSYGGGAASGELLDKVARVLTLRSEEEVYSALCALGSPASRLLGAQAEVPIEPYARPSPAAEFVGRMQYYDLLTYLPDDILVKVDRASMAVGLEARVPLLDDAVVEFAAGLPTAAKIQDRRSKLILRSVLERHLPASLFDRPKAGFGVPLGDWLRGPLRDWAEPLLRRPHEYLDARAVASLWHSHLHGTRMQRELWAVLMLQAWQEAQRGPRTLAAVAI